MTTITTLYLAIYINKTAWNEGVDVKSAQPPTCVKILSELLNWLSRPRFNE